MSETSEAFQVYMPQEPCVVLWDGNEARLVKDADTRPGRGMSTTQRDVTVARLRAVADLIADEGGPMLKMADLATDGGDSR